jgi:DNA-binding response OmpR family regulator
MADILIVEDDKPISDLILMNLRLVGHSCRQAFDAREAEAEVAARRPDLVLLDAMIPYRDGFSLMERKAFGGAPVIFLTAKTSTADKVRGLGLGADDYIAKPFETAELLARVKAVLRRTSPADRVFYVETTAVYLDKRLATVEGRPVELTNREFELMEALISNRNIALSREKLLDLAWGYDYAGDTRTVDVHITKLRKKLRLENHIKTVYKLGYRLEV